MIGHTGCFRFNNPISKALGKEARSTIPLVTSWVFFPGYQEVCNDVRAGHATVKLFPLSAQDFVFCLTGFFHLPMPAQTLIAEMNNFVSSPPFIVLESGIILLVSE